MDTRMYLLVNNASEMILTLVGNFKSELFKLILRIDILVLGDCHRTPLRSQH